MSLSVFVETINQKLKPLFDTWPGAKLFGLSQIVQRRMGTESESLPALVDNNGEAVYIGVDDTAPVILYHRLNNTTITERVVNATGDERSLAVNTYQCSVVVYIDSKRVDARPDQLFLFIQANFPEVLKQENYKGVNIRITGMNMNARSIFEREYQGTDFNLPVEKTLFEIIYTIESIFSKKCFEKCPC